MKRARRRTGWWRLETTSFKCYQQVMNAPFKPEPIVPILANVGVSISDLKRNPAAAIDAARSQQVAILNRNKPVAYLIAPEVWEGLCDMVEDANDVSIVKDRVNNPGKRIEISIDDLV